MSDSQGTGRDDNFLMVSSDSLEANSMESSLILEQEHSKATVTFGNTATSTTSTTATTATTKIVSTSASTHSLASPTLSSSTVSSNSYASVARKGLTTSSLSEVVASESLSLLKELEAIASQGRTFENWARTFRCVPEQYYTPSTQEDVVKIIHLARLNRKQVKAIGTGHSPSDLACTDGYMVNTDKLNRLIGVDTAKKQITVEAGMKLHKLHALLELHDLAMSNLGSISDQSVAGVMATATHGTGAKYSTMCASVIDLTLITALGETLFCSATENQDIFNAAICSLGALGIITKMTLQCEPAYKLETRQEPSTLPQVLSNLDTYIHSAEHVRFWWYPHTDKVVIWSANRTNKEITKPGPSTWRTSTWFTVHLYQGLLYICRFIPKLIPTLSRFMFWATSSKPLTRVGKSVDVFNFDCLFPQYVNEWAIPWNHTKAAIQELEAFIEQDVPKTSLLRVHFPIEIRFVAKEESTWMSPAFGVDSCYIGIIMYRPYGLPVPYKKFWRGFEEIMKKYQGRPHWAKAHGLTYQDLKERYPRFEDFCKVRKELDPEGMFLNEYLKRHIVAPEEGGLEEGEKDEAGEEEEEEKK